ncbi:MAG TPA: PKD domain-containing protein, partial [Bacteroidia bacterium]|nr:PKD domain-containing protein [Bacteroidia bacterium]
GTVCAGSSATLTASGGTTYTWTANPAPTAGLTTTTGASITVKPTATTTYTVTSPSVTNLILNPGFESGNVLFNSDYIYFSATNLPISNTEETYGIVKNPTNFNTSFSSFTDHSGNGYMLVADGAIQNDPTYGTSPIVPSQARVWSQTVAVIPGTTYTFSYWLQQGDPQAPQANMQVKINNVALGTATATNAWVLQTYTWTATSTSAIISLYDLSTNSSGNDLAIDDLSFTSSCLLTYDTTVYVNPAPVAGISNDTSICSGATPAIVIVGTPLSNVTYKQVGGSDQTQQLFVPPSLPADTGLYQVPVSSLTANTQYVVESVASGTAPFCSRVVNDTMHITVVALPTTVTIGNDTSVCTGQTASVYFKGASLDSVTYTMDSSAVTVTKTIPLGLTGNTTLLTGPITTQTIVTLVSVKHPGTLSCSQPLSGSVTLSIGNPPTASISGDTAICDDSPATNIIISGTPGATVTYDVIQGGVTISSNSITLNAVGSNSFSTGLLNTTTVYQLRSVSLSAACVNPLTSFATVTINPLPTVGFKITQASLCAATEIDFIDTSFFNIQSRSWNFGDGTPASQQINPSHIYASANTYTVSLQVTDNNGCTNKTAPSIVVNPLPQPGFLIPVICMAGGTATVQLTATNSGTANITGWQ